MPYLSFIGRSVLMAQGETIGGKQNYHAEQYQTDEYIRRWVCFSRRGERYQIRNKISPTTIVAAITSRQNKAKLPTHIEINEDVFEKNSIVLLEQIRTVDKRRLKEYVGKLDNGTIERVNKAISISVGLTDNAGENKNDSRTG